MTDRSSPLELEQADKTFLDSNELIINMGPQHPAFSARNASSVICTAG